MPESTPIVLTKRFRRQRGRLAPPAQAAVEKTLKKLQRGAGSLKALVAYTGLFELRAAHGLRLIVERADGGPGWIVRSVGAHDPILRRP